MNRNIIAAIAGVIFEGYNNIVYGFFAVILAPLFFPNTLCVSPITASFIVFAIGFAGRPFGGIIFGYIGDRFGRKLALTLSSFLVTIPTFIIGILPTYDSIGFFSPLLLIVCRLLQGMAIGADYTGVLIYVSEQVGVKNRSFITSILVSLGFFGAALGIAISCFLSSTFMPEESWRLSFVLAAVAGIFVCYLRVKMEESPFYQHIKTEEKLERNPLISSLKRDKKQLFASCILGGANLVPVYLATVYLNSLFKELLGLSNNAILLDNFLVFLGGGILILSSSRLISKYGEIKIIKMCMYTFILFSIPFFIYVFNNLSLTSLILLQVFLISGDALQIVALANFLPKLFPSSRRYSALGTSYSLGQAILGGTTPLIASFLTTITGDFSSVSYFLVGASVLYLVAISVAQQSTLPAHGKKI
jgi:MHS family proline/betaine transporter-like MFS transporter